MPARTPRTRALPGSALEPSAAPEALRRARISANRKVVFIAHATIYALGSLLVFVVAGFFAGVIVLLGWTIAVFCHGYFAVAAPALRARFIAGDLSRAEPRSGGERDRADAESRHARALADLSAAIAHEIRNPITAAKSLVQQIAEDPSLPENREYATVAVQELDRVERSIAHLLRFARDEPRQVATVELGEVATAALALLQERISGGGVLVGADLAETISLEADADQLRRVVVNVVGNALEALAEAGTAEPRIDVELGTNLARTEAWLTVTDNGPGIPEARISSIFAPFYTSKAAGTGLGLALSKKILEEHGGGIEVKNRPGGGAEFLITLPLRQARPAAAREGRE